VRVLLPVPTEPSTPMEPVALLMAALVLDVNPVAVFARPCVEPSEQLPAAVTCRVWPMALAEAAGTTLTVCGVAAVTLRGLPRKPSPPMAASVLLPAPAQARWSQRRGHRPDADLRVRVLH
jgi:hypothetical protein